MSCSLKNNKINRKSQSRELSRPVRKWVIFFQVFDRFVTVRVAPTSTLTWQTSNFYEIMMYSWTSTFQTRMNPHRIQFGTVPVTCWRFVNQNRTTDVLSRRRKRFQITSRQTFTHGRIENKERNAMMLILLQCDICSASKRQIDKHGAKSGSLFSRVNLSQYICHYAVPHSVTNYPKTMINFFQIRHSVLSVCFLIIPQFSSNSERRDIMRRHRL